MQPYKPSIITICENAKENNVKRVVDQILKDLDDYVRKFTLDCPFILNDTGSFPPVIRKVNGRYMKVDEDQEIDLPNVRPVRNIVVQLGEQLTVPPQEIQEEEIAETRNESAPIFVEFHEDERFEKIEKLKFIVLFSVVMQLYWTFCDFLRVWIVVSKDDYPVELVGYSEFKDVIGLRDRVLTRGELENLLIVGNVERNPGPRYRFIDRFSWKDRKKSSVDGFMTIHSLTSFKDYVKASLREEVITRVDYSVTVKSKEKFPVIAMVIDKPENKEIVDLATAMVHSSGSTPYFIDSEASVFIQHSFKYPKSLHLYVFSFYESDKFSAGYMAVECYDVYTRAGSYSAPPRMIGPKPLAQGQGRGTKQKAKGKKQKKNKQEGQVQQQGGLGEQPAKRRRQRRKPKKKVIEQIAPPINIPS